jgi:hypothetical protein
MAPTGPTPFALVALADRLTRYNPWLRIVLTLREIRTAPHVLVVAAGVT